MADTGSTTIEFEADQSWKLISDNIANYLAQAVGTISVEVVPHTSNSVAPVLGANDLPMSLSDGNMLNRAGIWWGRSATNGHKAYITVVS